MTMYVGIHGTRGSVPIAEKEFLEFGGNTSSYTVLTDAGSLVFLDAGTGMRKAAQRLKEGPENLFLMLSHGHQDHVHGLGFTNIAYTPLPSKLNILLPQTAYNGIQQIYSGDAFPISPDADMRNINLRTASILTGDERLTLDKKTEMHTLSVHHPRRRNMDGSMLYRFEQEKVNFVFATDFEIDYLAPGIINPSADALEKRITHFFRDADLVLCDGQYTQNEYTAGKIQG